MGVHDGPEYALYNTGRYAVKEGFPKFIKAVEIAAEKQKSSKS